MPDPQRAGPGVGLPHLLLASSMALVGANVPIGKEVAAAFPTLSFLALRFVVALVSLLPLAGSATRAELRSLDRTGIALVTLQALIGMIGFSALMLEGLRLTQASSAGIITASLPAAVLLLAVLTLGERPGGRGFAAVLMAVLGVAVVNLEAVPAAEASDPRLGNLLVLAAVFAEAGYVVITRRLGRSLSPSAQAIAVNGAGFVLLLPVLLAGQVPWPEASPGQWGLAVFYAFTASVLAILLWYRGVMGVSASVAGLFTAVLPVTAVLVAAVGFGERLGPWHLLGGVLVLAGIALGSRGRG